MGIWGKSPEQKWIEENKNTNWNRMFTGFGEVDVMLTKLILFECVHFADKLLSSDVFNATNMVLRGETIVLAKMQFYHLLTKSPTVHNLFYGYAYELWVNHYKEDDETARLAISQMQKNENWIINFYYDFGDSKQGEFKNVLNQYCESVSHNKTTEGTSVLSVDLEELKHYVAKGLMDMQVSFMRKVGNLYK